MKLKNKKVVLGMSGGVDSSVALYLLKKQGFEVIGVSLKFSHWESDKNKLRENVCCSEKSIQRAKKVCQKYKTPHFIVDATKEFQSAVIDYFIQELRSNFTPSPCLFCNRDVKIALLLSFAKEQGIGLAATGHYAKIKEKGGKYCLFQAKDKKKDQSYFLCLLRQEQLSRLVLPLAEYSKEQVYQMAEREKIDTSPRQSQDLCFVADNSVKTLLEETIGTKKGKIVGQDGNVLGEHSGLHFFTIGQRKGIELSGGPYWVTGMDVKKNILFVTGNGEDPALFSKEVALGEVNFISGEVPAEPIEIEAKCRFQQPLARAMLYPEANNKTKLVFEKPQKAVAPGQIAAFYRGKECLGGGTIKSAKLKAQS